MGLGSFQLKWSNRGSLARKEPLKPQRLTCKVSCGGISCAKLGVVTRFLFKCIERIADPILWYPRGSMLSKQLPKLANRKCWRRLLPSHTKQLGHSAGRGLTWVFPVARIFYVFYLMIIECKIYKESLEMEARIQNSFQDERPGYRVFWGWVTLQLNKSVSIPCRAQTE